MKSMKVPFMLFVVSMFFGLVGAGAMEFQVESWNNPFLPNTDDSTGWTPTPFNSEGSLGQTFETTGPMVGVQIKSPSWSGAGACFTMALYTWNTDYATSIAGPALGVATFTSYTDNGFQEMMLDQSVPAGQYLLHTYNPVWGTAPDTGQPGHWGWSGLTEVFANPVPAAYKDGVIMDGNLFRINWATGVERNYTTVESFFTEGTTTAIPLSSYPKIGQRVTATQPFDGIEVHSPSWSLSHAKGYTLRLYNWAGSYEATVAQTPLATNVYEGIIDNFWYPVLSDTILPAGEYFWEMSEPTGPDANVGMWMVTNSEYAGGEAYFNGVAQSSNSTTEVFPFDNQGSGTAIQFGDWLSMGISFETPGRITEVGIVSPSWGPHAVGSGAGYRMSLYEWNTDYNTTINGTPIVQQTFADYPDNNLNKMAIPNGVPAGQYLLLTDEPVKGVAPNTGIPGHWGYINSPLITGADVPNTYYDGYKQTDYPDQFNKTTFRVYYLLDKVTGPDFKSRSVLKPTAVNDWTQY